VCVFIDNETKIITKTCWKHVNELQILIRAHNEQTYSIDCAIEIHRSPLHVERSGMCPAQWIIICWGASIS
jgi:hypothetical protein